MSDLTAALTRQLSEALSARFKAEAGLAAARSALEKADQFITNGIALGFIRMPDPGTPDSAHATPGIIRAALSTLAQEPAGQSEASGETVDRDAIIDKLWDIHCPGIRQTPEDRAFYGNVVDTVTAALLPAGSASPGVTEPVALEALKAALIDACKTMRNARGAIESNQVVDKDVRGMLLKGQARINVALSAHPTVKVSGDADPDEYFRDDPMFNKGVLHCQDLLGQVLGNPEYYAADGSEDYDTDLSDTLVNMLSAAGCYDKDEGKLAQIVSEVSGDAAEMRERAAQEAHAVAYAHAHHALWAGIIEYGWDEATEKFGRALANRIADGARSSIRALPLTPEGRS